MRKNLALSAVLAAAMLGAASLALAATPLKTGLIFTGSTAHRHYSLTVGTQCPGKKCTRATLVAVVITAGNPRRQISGCPSGGYAMPDAKLTKDRFSATNHFIISGKTLPFKITGAFVSASRVTGTVTGAKACGGSDHFALNVAKAKPRKIGG